MTTGCYWQNLVINSKGIWQMFVPPQSVLVPGPVGLLISWSKGSGQKEVVKECRAVLALYNGTVVDPTIWTKAKVTLLTVLGHT